jgi:hypothetical protein
MGKQVVIMKFKYLILLLMLFLMFPLAQATETIWTGLSDTGGCYTSINLNLLGCNGYHFGDNVTVRNVRFWVHTCGAQNVFFAITGGGIELWNSGIHQCILNGTNMGYCDYNYSVNLSLNSTFGNYFEFRWYGAGNVINMCNSTSFPVYPVGYSSGNNYLIDDCGTNWLCGTEEISFDLITTTTTTIPPRVRCVIMDCSSLRGFPMVIIGFLCSMANFLFCFPLLLGVLIVLYVVYKKWFKK